MITLKNYVGRDWTLTFNDEPIDKIEDISTPILEHYHLTPVGTDTEGRLLVRTEKNQLGAIAPGDVGLIWKQMAWESKVAAL